MVSWSSAWARTCSRCRDIAISDFRLRIALPLNLKSKFENPKSRPERKSNRCSELDRVTLQFIIKRGPLNAEKLRGFFLVAVTLRERLKDRVPLDLVQTLHTCARRSTALRLLQHRGQLHLGGQLFHANQILPRQHHRVFHCVLQLAHVAGPRIIEQFLESIRRDGRFGFAELLGELFHNEATSGGMSCFRSRSGGT